MEIAQEKGQLRKQLLAKRQAIPAADKLAATQAVANHFADHPYLTYAASFAGYYAMRGELDVLAVFNRMARFGKQMALPAIQAEGKTLAFRLWQPGHSLETAAHGAKQPADMAEAIVPEVVLVPLLAFDSQGNRLGYGGGYYDATIYSLRQSAENKTLFIGVGFAGQELAQVPVDEADQRLDGVLTEEGVSIF